MARTLTAGEAKVVALPEYSVFSRVSIKDAAGTYVDYSTLEGRNWITGVEYEFDIDQNVATASIGMRLDDFMLSLGSLVTLSKINRPLGSYAARLTEAREVKIETAMIPLGAAPAAGDWRLVFHGWTYEVDTPLGAESGSVRVNCRDLAAKLLGTFIEQNGRPGPYPTAATAYAPTVDVAVETVMQQILDDWGPGSITLSVPVSPGWALKGLNNGPSFGYRPALKSVFDALNELAAMIGWVVRYKFDSGTGDFKLTFYEPARTKVLPDITLQPAQILSFPRFSKTDEGIRNKIRVEWFNVPDQNPPSFVQVTDAASIAAYGTRFGMIAEGKSSAINTITEATKLANAALADLATVKADAEVELRYRYDFEIEDLIQLAGTTRIYDTAQNVAITTIRAKLDPAGGHVTIAVRGGAPAGAYWNWWQSVLTAPAIPLDTTVPGYTLTATAKITGATLLLTNGPTNAKRFAGTEFHVSTTNGFTPDASSLKQFSMATSCEVTGLTQGTTYYAKAIVRLIGGIASAASAQVSFVPGQIATADLADGIVTNIKVNAAAAIVGTKLAAGAGALANLDNAGALDFAPAHTNKHLDNIGDGTTYKRIKSVSSGNQVQAASVATGAVVPSHITSAIAFSGNMAPNGNFSAFPSGTGVEPDGWAMSSSTWDATHVSAASSPVLSGTYSLKFNLVLSRGLTPEITSQPWPVSGGYTYMYGVEEQHDTISGNGKVEIKIDWLDAAQAHISYSASHVVSGGPVNTWVRKFQIGEVAPSTARYARIVLTGTDPTTVGDFHEYIDYVFFLPQDSFGAAFPTAPFDGQQFYRTDLFSSFAWNNPLNAWTAITPARYAAFSVRRNAALNVGIGAVAQIPFDTETAPNFDIGNDHAAGVFTAPIAGYYRFSAFAGLAAMADQKQIVVAIRKGGANVAIANNWSSGAGVGMQIGVSICLKLAVSDTVDVAITNGDGVIRALLVGAADNNFSGELLFATDI